jgi:hypothetical protein
LRRAKKWYRPQFHPFFFLLLRNLRFFTYYSSFSSAIPFFSFLSSSKKRDLLIPLVDKRFLPKEFFTRDIAYLTVFVGEQRNKGICKGLKGTP